MNKIFQLKWRLPLVVGCLLLFAFSTFGQDKKYDKEKRNQIESQRIAFITIKLDLSPDESKLFWPLYNTYEKNMDEIRSRGRVSQEEIEAMSENEAVELLKQWIERDRQYTALKREYIEEMKKILPARKVALLQIVDREFKRDLLRKMHESRSDKTK